MLYFIAIKAKSLGSFRKGAAAALATICAGIWCLPAQGQWIACSGGSTTCSSVSTKVGVGSTTPGKLLEISLSDNSNLMGDTGSALLLRNTAGYNTRSAIDFYGNAPFTNEWRYAAIEGLVTGEGAAGEIGAILFGTKPSILSTTLSERMRIDPSGNVGIGTTSPGAILDINGGDVRVVAPNTGFVIQAPNSWSNGWSRGFNFTDANNSTLAQFGAYGAGAPSTLNYAFIGSSVTSPWITFQPGGNVGIGTTVPQHLLSVNGTIGAHEVVVVSTGADYVFDADYQLKSLGDIADYIAANHHLPEIPSAKENAEKGVGIGEMQTRLLAKIEELTLHMIQEDQRVRRLEEENLDLRRIVERSRP